MNKIMIVLVLYNKKIAQFAAYSTLQQLVNRKEFSVLLYDNGLTAQVSPITAENFTYLHDRTNPGLAKAYNKGWQQAKELDCDTLFLLDDDTEISLAYLEQLLQTTPLKNTGAVVPLVYSDGKQISPVYADQYINRDSQFPQAGIPTRRVMSINSAAAIPVKTLDKIGGFNEDFPLDFLDHWFFWKIYQEGLTVQILDTKIKHHLSVLDYSNVSPTRYQNILKAEKLFYEKYDTKFASEHHKQLFKRLAKQLLTVKNRKIWRITLHNLFR